MVLERVLAVLAAVLLLPALVVTGARLGDPAWGPLVQLVAFTPLALPLYAGGLALLVLLVVARVRRGRRGRATGLAATGALVALAGLVLHAAWFAPQLLGEAPAAAEGAEPVVVMTSNLLFGRADAAALVAQVRARPGLGAGHQRAHRPGPGRPRGGGDRRPAAAPGRVRRPRGHRAGHGGLRGRTGRARRASSTCSAPACSSARSRA